jgi:hypothetical protein
VQEANEMIVSDGSVEAYEAFVALYVQPPLGPQAREWLDRHYRMVAWSTAVAANTAAAYREFLVKYPDSDLTATARKLEERTRNRVALAALAVSPIPVALAGPSCPCGAPAVAPIKASLPKPEPKKKPKADPDRRAERSPPRRMRDIDDEVVVIQRAPVDVAPAPGISIGGYGRYGYGGGYGGYSRGGLGGGYGGGNTGGRGRFLSVNRTRCRVGGPCTRPSGRGA